MTAVIDVCPACQLRVVPYELCKWCHKCRRCSPVIGYYQDVRTPLAATLCIGCVGCETVFCDKCTRVGPCIAPCHCPQCFRRDLLCGRCHKCLHCTPKDTYSSYCRTCRPLVLRDARIRGLSTDAEVSKVVTPVATTSVEKSSTEVQQSAPQAHDLDIATPRSQEQSLPKPAEALVVIEHVPTIKDRLENGLRLTLPPLRGPAPRIKLPDTEAPKIIDLDDNDETVAKEKTPLPIVKDLASPSQATLEIAQLIESKRQKLLRLSRLKLRVLARLVGIKYYGNKTCGALVDELAMHSDCSIDSINILLR
jgi:hypothetical protein